MADKNVELVLKDVRLSFVHVFSPQKFTDKKTGAVRWGYGLSALIPKLIKGVKNPMSVQISEAVKKAIALQWPGEKKVIPPDRRCYRDGEPIDPDTVDPDIPGSGTRNPLYDGYAGMNVLVCNRGIENFDDPNPIQILGPKKTAVGADGKPAFPRLKKSDRLIYSGMFGDLIVRIYGYDGTKLGVPDRVNCSLEAVKFRRHGEAFGAAAVDADNIFEDEASDEFGDDDLDAPVRPKRKPVLEDIDDI